MTGLLWPSELISRPRGTGTRGPGSWSGRGSGWSLLNANREDPVEMALAAGSQKSALAHVANSSCGKKTGQFNMLVTLCEALAEPRVPLPVSDATVAHGGPASIVGNE
jgi:hypothetical protein